MPALRGKTFMGAKLQKGKETMLVLIYKVSGMRVITYRHINISIHIVYEKKDNYTRQGKK